MIWQSKILLKSSLTPLICSKKNAEYVLDVFSNPEVTKEHVINVERLKAFTKGEIRDITVLPDLNDTARTEDMRKFYQEESDKRSALLRRTNDQKADDLILFSHLYKLTTGDDPSPEKLSQARTIQLRFFKENPRRTICYNPQLKSIIPIVAGKRLNPWQSGFFQIIERAIARDMQLSR